MQFKKLIVLFFISCIAFNAESQDVEMMKFNDLSEIIHRNNDSLYIINFWATWCRPCIEELPAFERIEMEYREKAVSIILVNLDFHSKVESLVKPFLSKRQLHSKVVHITDTDPNDWINRIDERWSGAIPATVIYRNGKSLFFREGSVSYEELKSAVDNNLK